MKIYSKRHLYKFYLPLVFLNLFFIGIGSIFLFASIKDIGSFLFIIFIALTVYFNYSFIINSPKIILTKEGIHIKNIFYSWKDLNQVKLTGKSSLFFSPSECAFLSFNNFKTIKIHDDLYSNSSEMKCFIQDVVIDKKEKFEYPKTITNEINGDNEFFIPYKGNPIFSFRGILMWGLIMFFIFLLFFSKKNITIKIYMIFIPLCIFWFLINAWLMCYFEISKNYFTVKNHYFFWKNDLYKVSNIKEIVFETQYKQPNKLRIITNDFKYKVYPAGSLTDKIWIEMKKELETKNVIVRNECIPE